MYLFCTATVLKNCTLSYILQEEEKNPFMLQYPLLKSDGWQKIQARWTAGLQYTSCPNDYIQCSLCHCRKMPCSALLEALRLQTSLWDCTHLDELIESILKQMFPFRTLSDVKS